MWPGLSRRTPMSEPGNPLGLCTFPGAAEHTATGLPAYSGTQRPVYSSAVWVAQLGPSQGLRSEIR